MALVPFLMPLQILCAANGAPAWFSTSGLFVCAQSAQQGEVRVKLPPSRGQFRAVDCDADLTPDGTPDDFNRNVVVREFLWFRMARKFRDNHFHFRFPRPASKDDCPAVLSLTGEESGTQRALVDYHGVEKDPLEATYQCRGQTYSTFTGSPWSAGYGAGGCVALEGAQAALSLATPWPRGTIRAVSSSCGLKLEKTFGPSDLTYKDRTAWVSIPWAVPQGMCPVVLELTTEEGVRRAQITFIGNARDRAEIDSPRLVQDGKFRRVLSPLFTTAFDVQAIVGEAAIWRAQSEDWSPQIPPGIPSDAKICAAAWGRENSVSAVCFEAVSGKEVPYDFR